MSDSDSTRQLREQLASIGADASSADEVRAALAEVAQVGNIEALRRYWTTGPGGVRIRWGTDGDLTRCHRYVRREVPRTEMSDDDIWGFCQNLHIRVRGRPNPRD